MASSSSGKRSRPTWKRDLEATDSNRDGESTTSKGGQKACIKETSCLADRLLIQWSAGMISAVQVQLFAHAAVLDGASHPELAKLASCGNFGAHPGNCARDITRMFLHQTKIPEAVLVPTLAMDPKTGQQENIGIATFLPHLMFHSLQFYDNFEHVLGTAKVEEFWQGIVAVQDPKLGLYGFPSDSENWKGEFIPCFIHGDGAAFQTRDSLMAFSWGSLLSNQASVDMSFLLAGFPKSCTIKDGHAHSTWKPVWEWIVWSFKAAFQGVHPDKDPFGQPFPSNTLFAKLAGSPLNPKGYKLCAWVLQGDHEYFSNMLDLPHWSSNKCCWSCNTLADSAELTWKTLKQSPTGWQEYSIQDAIANQPEHPFFSLPGVTPLSVGHDGLHVLFCKGVLSYVMGGCLHTMLWPKKGRQSMPPQKRLDLIWSRVQQLYSQNKSSTRFTNLTMSMICNADKPWADVPFLKAKGAECKHFLPVLAIIAREVSTGSEHDVHRTRVLQVISEFCALLDSRGMFLTQSESTNAVHLIDEFFEHVLWLQNWAQTEERLAYHVTIKFHMLHHLALAAKFLNPRVYWCFRAEDLVGKLATMAFSVSMGVRSTQLSVKLCAKYREFLHFRFTRGDQVLPDLA